MKKFIFLLPVLILFIPFNVSAESKFCAQVIQPAINSNGVCEEFDTPCDVPNGWKNVSSCEAVKKVIAQKKKRSATTKRLSRKNWSKLRNRSRNTRANAPKSRFGAGSYTRSTKPKTNAVRAQKIKRVDTSARNTFTKKRFTRNALNKYKSRNRQKASYKQEGELTNNEKYQKRVKKWKKWGQRRPATISRSRTTGKRVGNLSKTKWTKNTKNRFRERNVGGSSPYWKSPLDRRTKIKKKRTPRVITNKRSWKGNRLEGTLDGQITD